MPVPSSINDIYTVAGSNPPGGGETPAEGDNHLRAAYSFIAALRDILNGTSSTTAAVQSLAVSGAAAFGGATSFAGAASFNGSVAIGNAGSDTLTVNATATFQEASSFNGAVALGNAAADEINVEGTLSATPTAAFASGLSLGNSAQAGAATLDWYEEGTFTPTVRFGALSTGVTYGLDRGGFFTRIGNTVKFRLIVTLTNKGSATGTASVGGLPYQAASGVATETICSVDALSLTGLTGAVGAAVLGETSVISLYQWGSTGGAAISDTNFTNTSVLFISGSYQAG